MLRKHVFVYGSMQNVSTIWFDRDYNLLLLTTFTDTGSESVLWMNHHMQHDAGVANSETVLNSGEVMVVYGNIRDIKKMLEKQ
ncbi:hypothetical protein [Fulvivirga sedimenti]|uniref:Uncharacterized protein n=1 Tax=Fulvivirga sedimenti TaxID=2879465 RepID=A0A9X1KYF7_9BACT|nr:hypothetical protein [Fulvivirga sedimenti]MCA6073561.1 hypothetical protein [Fulvivirga sedimenti]